MKIAYFLDTQKSPGGAGLLLIKNAILMQSQNEVEVVIPDSNGYISNEYVEICQVNKIMYEIQPYQTSNDIANIDFYDSFVKKDQIKNYLLNNKIQFVHYVQLNIAVEMACRELDIPHLMSAYQLEENEYNGENELIFSRFHLCDSFYYSKVWENVLKIESKVIRPVSPVGENQIYDKNYNEDKIQMLMAGVLCERKNQLSVIKAVHRLSGEINISLTILGAYDNKYGLMCKKYVDDNGISNTVELLGFRTDVNKYMQESDIFICSSNNESFPSSIVEALTYGNVIVSTPVGGVTEVFKDEYNAIISNGYDEESIYIAIKRAIESIKKPEKINRIKEKMVNTWNSCFSQESCKKQLMDYYESIVNSQIRRDNSIYSDIKIQLDELMLKMNRIPEDLRDKVTRRLLNIQYVLKRVKGREVYIWGAGESGRFAFYVLKILGENVSILGFIDSVKEGEKEGLPIFNPNYIEKQNKRMCLISFEGEKQDVINKIHEAKWGKDSIVIFY